MKVQRTTRKYNTKKANWESIPRKTGEGSSPEELKDIATERAVDFVEAPHPAEHMRLERYCTETVEKCGHCGGPHRQSECVDKEKGVTPVCVNCKNEKHSDTGHNAFSACCPVRRKWDSIARARVAYN
ncbi:hypothetical protein ACJJTC_013598 [Scirpophaga incertulas]